MKQFGLFPVVGRMVAIIHGQHILYTHTGRSNIYTLKKYLKKNNTNNGHGGHILNSIQTDAC